MEKNLLAGLAIAFALAVSGPALAATGSATLDSLLASGYEVKAVTQLLDEATKQIYPGQTLPPQTVITLQKGNALAVCNMATANWMNINDASFTSTDRCSTR